SASQRATLSGVEIVTGGSHILVIIVNLFLVFKMNGIALMLAKNPDKNASFGAAMWPHCVT
ncbi:MAG: hypothetical protein P8P56_12050, partial [Yoonia sp.]|nr:hypothetical protein [Yoonia sp.]